MTKLFSKPLFASLWPWSRTVGLPPAADSLISLSTSRVDRRQAQLCQMEREPCLAPEYNNRVGLPSGGNPFSLYLPGPVEDSSGLAFGTTAAASGVLDLIQENYVQVRTFSTFKMAYSDMSIK